MTASAGTVHAHLDSVTVQGWHCPITQIRPVDYARMRADTPGGAEKAKSSG